jgi:hypothetical protein
LPIKDIVNQLESIAWKKRAVTQEEWNDTGHIQEMSLIMVRIRDKIHCEGDMMNNDKNMEKHRKHICTVGRLDGNSYIRLRGKWLEEAGFKAGDRFNVEVQGKRLVLKRIEK